jgi:hypothetical protein
MIGFMKQMAEQNAIKFVSLPSAVYHWRKHTSWNANRRNYYNISAYRHSRRANELIENSITQRQYRNNTTNITSSCNNSNFISVVRKQWPYRLLSHRPK